MKRMALVLTAVAVLAGLILASAYAAFLPRIKANQELALTTSLAGLFSGVENPVFSPIETGGEPSYRVEDAAGNVVGYAAQVKATGYGGAIRMLVGLSADFSEITGLEVVENVETPGLGGRITEDWFKDQFAALDPLSDIRYLKNAKPDPAENEVEAISGATISTTAVVTALNTSLVPVIEKLKQEAGN